MNNWNYAGAGFWSIFFIIGIETGVAFNYFDEPNISSDTSVRSFNERCSELLLDFFTEYYSTLLEDHSIDHTLKANNSSRNNPSRNNSSRNNSTRTESNPANRARELMSELFLSLDPPLASIALQYLDRNDSKMAEKEHNLSWIVHEAVAKILSDRNASSARRTLDEVLRTKRETHLVWGYLLDVLEEAAAELQRSVDAELNQELLRSLEQRFRRQTGSFALNATGRITTPEPDSLLQRLEPIPQRLQQILLSQGFDARSSIADMVSFVVQIFQSFADRLRSEIPAAGISRLHGDNKLFDRLLPNLAVLAASPRQNERNTPQTSANEIQRLVSKGKTDELSVIWDAVLNSSNDSRVLKRVKRVGTPQKTGENSVVPPSVKTNMIDDTKVAKNISRRQIPLVFKPVPIISTITVTSAPSRSVSETPVEKLQVDANQSRGIASPSRVDVLEVQGKPMGNVSVTSSPQGTSVSSNQTVKPVVETSVPKVKSDPVRASAATIPNDLVRKTEDNQASTGLPGSTLGTPTDVQGGSVSGANTSVSDSPKTSTTSAVTNPPAKSELPQQTSTTVLAKAEPSNAAKSLVSNHPVEPSNAPALKITKPEINGPPKSQVATNAVSDPVKALVPVSQLPVVNPPAKPVFIPAIPPTNISTQPVSTSSNELLKSVALLNTSVQPVSINDPVNDSTKAVNSSVAAKSAVNLSSTDAAVMKSPTETQNTGTGNQTTGTGNQTTGTGNQTVGTGNQTAGTGNQTAGTQPSSIGTSSQTVPPSIAIQYLNSGVSSETKTLPGVVVGNVPPVPGNGSSAIVNVSTLALTNVTGFMKEIPDQAAEQAPRMSKLSDANILEHNDYFNRGDIRSGGIQQYAGFVVVLVVLSLIVIGSVLFWKFSTETGASGGENTTTRENLNSMNNYCYLTNNSNNCARTTGRTPDRVNLDDERSARSQLIELTQLRKSEVSV
nr:PREDICTED: uncharacterized threonine-rich GPI-anchored glycoprotein PJ4664.02-like isoform X2 [Bemisia tabaci]